MTLFFHTSWALSDVDGGFPAFTREFINLLQYGKQDMRRLLNLHWQYSILVGQELKV